MLQPPMLPEHPADQRTSMVAIPTTTTPTNSRPESSFENENDTKPPTALVKGSTAEAPLMPSDYFGSSPWKHKFGGHSLSEFRAFAAPQSPSLYIQYRSPSALATANVNKAMASAGDKISHTLATETPNEVYQDGHQTGQKVLPSMHGYGFCEEDADGLQLPILPRMMSMRGGIDNNVALHHVANDADDITNHVESLRQVTDSHTGKVDEFGQVLSEMILANRGFHTMINALSHRMVALEYNNYRLESIIRGRSFQEDNGIQSAPAVQSQSLLLEAGGKRSRSPSPARLERSYRERRDCTSEDSEQNYTPGSNRRNKIRKQLQIEIPGAAVHSLEGLPTPLTRANTATFNGLSSSMPKTPITPGRIGPGSVNKRSSTSINKRKNHSLDKMLPPAYVQVPHVPLTDTEIIVYFFQSLSRPNVALRLYAREWGPRNIVDALHSHRHIEPPYLRNTCSVKCTTAIKMGRKKYGHNWEEEFKHNIKGASDEQATDLMRLDREEREHAHDYDVRSLCVGLIKHPEEGIDGGIFTRCVKYCQENDAPYTVHNIWKLADDLESGRTPKHPKPLKNITIGANGGFPLSSTDVDKKQDNDEQSDVSPRRIQDRVPAARNSPVSSPDHTITRSSTPDSVLDDESAENEETT